MYFVYILHNTTIDKFYTGFTHDIEARLLDHNTNTNRSKYTRKQEGEWKLVYKEEFSDKSSALKREKEIKSKKSKIYILKLVEQSRL